MAQRRMFSLTIVDTDRFLEMSASAQALYFHLGIRADDEGFVSSPRKITMLAGCAADDLKILAAKGFIIPFKSGICVITDWKQNNYIQSDRFKPTVYSEEKSLLSTDKSGSYILCVQDVYRLDTQVRLELGKDSIGESGAPADAPKDARRKYGVYGWVRLSDTEYNRLLAEFGEKSALFYISLVDEKAQQTGNKNKWKDWNLTVRKAIREKWGGEPPQGKVWKSLD